MDFEFAEIWSQASQFIGFWHSLIHDPKNMHILGIMDEAMPKANELTSLAPYFCKFKVHKDKVKVVIGKGGSTIKGLQDEFGVTIELQDDGSVSVFGENKAVAEAAKEKIELMCAHMSSIFSLAASATALFSPKTLTLPSSCSSIVTPNSSCSPFMVEPPFPITTFTLSLWTLNLQKFLQIQSP